MARIVLSRPEVRYQPGALVVGALTALVIVVLVSGRPAGGSAAVALATGVAVSSALVLAAALANLARTVLGVEELWAVVVVLGALGAKVVVTTAFGVASAGPPLWSSNVALLADVVVLGLALATVSLAPRGRTGPSPLTIGVGLGLGVTTVLAVLPLAGAPWLEAATPALTLLVVVVYGVAAATVGRYWPWGPASRISMTAALLILGAAQVLEAYADVTDWTGVSGALAQLLGAQLIAGPMYSVVNSDLFADRRRLDVLRERVRQAEEAARHAREDRHALLNMVAGISLASELLIDDDDIGEAMRRRLEHTIHKEAVLVQALLQANPDAAWRAPAPQEQSSTMSIRPAS